MNESRVEFAGLKVFFATLATNPNAKYALVVPREILCRDNVATVRSVARM